jgi:WD40 repeat protein
LTKSEERAKHVLDGLRIQVEENRNLLSKSEERAKHVLDDLRIHVEDNRNLLNITAIGQGYSAWKTGLIGKAKQILADWQPSIDATGHSNEQPTWELNFVRGLCDLSETGNLALLGHAGAVYAVSKIPNQGTALIASAGDDGTVRVWNAKTGQAIISG